MRESDLQILASKQQLTILLVSAGIWRSRESNSAGVAGAAAAVHAIEWSMALHDAYAADDQAEFDRLLGNPAL